MIGGRDNEVHNVENALATQQLFAWIEQFAAWLDANYEKQFKKMELENHLTEIIHREGINVRYLGRLRSAVTTPYLKEVILNEMITRVVKNQLRLRLRYAATTTIKTSKCTDE
jgi:hypothetical protein